MGWAIGFTIAAAVVLWAVYRTTKDDEGHAMSLDEYFGRDEKYDDTHSIEEGDE